MNILQTHSAAVQTNQRDVNDTAGGNMSIQLLQFSSGHVSQKVRQTHHLPLLCQRVASSLMLQIHSAGGKFDTSEALTLINFWVNIWLHSESVLSQAGFKIHLQNPNQKT